MCDSRSPVWLAFDLCLRGDFVCPVFLEVEVRRGWEGDGGRGEASNIGASLSGRSLSR